MEIIFVGDCQLNVSQFLYVGQPGIEVPAFQKIMAGQNWRLTGQSIVIGNENQRHFTTEWCLQLRSRGFNDYVSEVEKKV